MYHALVCQHPLTKERKSAPTLTYRWLTVGFFGFTTRTGPHSVRKKSVLFNLIQHLYTNIINGTVGAWTKVVKLETFRLWVNFLHSHHSCLLIRWVIHSIYLKSALVYHSLCGPTELSQACTVKASSGITSINVDGPKGSHDGIMWGHEVTRESLRSVKLNTACKTWLAESTSHMMFSPVLNIQLAFMCKPTVF